MPNKAKTERAIKRYKTGMAELIARTGNAPTQRDYQEVFGRASSDVIKMCNKYGIDAPLPIDGYLYKQVRRNEDIWRLANSKGDGELVTIKEVNKIVDSKCNTDTRMLLDKMEKNGLSLPEIQGRYIDNKPNWTPEPSPEPPRVGGIAIVAMNEYGWAEFR